VGDKVNIAATFGHCRGSEPPADFRRMQLEHFGTWKTRARTSGRGSGGFQSSIRINLPTRATWACPIGGAVVPESTASAFAGSRVLRKRRLGACAVETVEARPMRSSFSASIGERE
jgi:hypothetical protein